MWGNRAQNLHSRMVAPNEHETPAEEEIDLDAYSTELLEAVLAILKAKTKRDRPNN